jgi:uncharacterized damage-inducible protein DinB
MISSEYCVAFARYNAWENSQLIDIVNGMTAAELALDRSAFFGSILGTLSHIVWGDLAWMSRLEGGEMPAGKLAETNEFIQVGADWCVERKRTDIRISQWVSGLSDADLQGDLTWYSSAAGRDVTKPKAMCVAHMFNHQTHHRGQVHAMLTAAGKTAPVSDIVFMPEGE